MDSPATPADIRVSPECFLCFLIEWDRTMVEKGSASWKWMTTIPDCACAWCWRPSMCQLLVTVGVPQLPSTEPGISMPLCFGCHDAIEAERENQEAPRRAAGANGLVLLDKLTMMKILTEPFQRQARAKPRHLYKGLGHVAHHSVKTIPRDGMPLELASAMNFLETLEGPRWLPPPRLMK